MAILARDGQTYARIRFDVGTHSEWELPVEVDYREEFGAADHKSWRSEYETCVQAETGFNCQQLEDEFFSGLTTPFIDGGPGGFNDLET